jgi:cytochrome P450
MAIASREELPARPGVWDPRTVPHTDETGAHHVYGYMQVLRLLADGEAFSSDHGARAGNAEHVRPMLLGLWTCDDPRHRDLRRALEGTLRRNRIQALRPQLRRLVDTLLDQVLARGDGRVELIADVAKPYHLLANCHLLGLDADHAPMFDGWVARAVHAPAGNGMEADPEQSAFWLGLIEERRAHPRTGLVDDLIAAQRAGHLVAGKRMSDWDLVGYLSMFLAAGYEVISAIANTILFADEFGALGALRANRGLLPGAVNESLRCYPPFVATQRTTTADVDLDGYTVEAGQRVVGWITAANHDPDRFPDANRYDVRRWPNPHLASGWGARHCLGVPMAQLEMLVGLDAILDRLPGLHCDRTQPLERTYGLVDPLVSLHCTFGGADR